MSASQPHTHTPTQPLFQIGCSFCGFLSQLSCLVNTFVHGKGTSKSNVPGTRNIYVNIVWKTILVPAIWGSVNLQAFFSNVIIIHWSLTVTTSDLCCYCHSHTVLKQVMSNILFIHSSKYLVLFRIQVYISMSRWNHISRQATAG